MADAGDAPLPTFTTLRLTRLGDFAVEVALNRPRKSNAIDGAMWRELRACFEALRTDCRRISIAMKIDYRDAPAGRLDAKVEAVEKHVGRNLAK